MMIGGEPSYNTRREAGAVCEEATKAVLEALRSYLKSNGRRILSILRALSQDEVAIEIHALYSYFVPRAKLSRLEKAVEILANAGVRKLAKGVSLEISDSIKIVVSADFVEEALRRDSP